jgi:hypothetical protein
VKKLVTSDLIMQAMNSIAHELWEAMQPSWTYRRESIMCQSADELEENEEEHE